MLILSVWFYLTSVGVGLPGWLPVFAMCLAIFADAAGFQPISYIIITDLFTFQVNTISFSRFTFFHVDNKIHPHHFDRGLKFATTLNHVFIDSLVSLDKGTVGFQYLFSIKNACVVNLCLFVIKAAANRTVRLRLDDILSYKDIHSYKHIHSYKLCKTLMVSEA